MQQLGVHGEVRIGSNEVSTFNEVNIYIYAFVWQVTIDAFEHCSIVNDTKRAMSSILCPLNVAFSSVDMVCSGRLLYLSR